MGGGRRAIAVVDRAGLGGAWVRWKGWSMDVQGRLLWDLVMLAGVESLGDGVENWFTFFIGSE